MKSQSIKPNLQRHNRCSIRLRGYDYSQPGGYFVTICTQGHDCIFGEVVRGEMQLNRCGEIVQEEWFKTPGIRSEIKLDAFIIMPNHVHGIVFIVDNPVGMDGIGAFGVGVHGRAPLQKHKQQTLHRRPKSLSSFIAGFKSVCTTRINVLRGTRGRHLWQRNYYEHIIRDDNELQRIQEYILNNPTRWQFDQENPRWGLDEKENNFWTDFE